MLKEDFLGTDHKSYTLVWALESTVDVEDFRIKYRKVRIRH